MLKVVSRNFQSKELKKESSNKPSSQVEKKSSWSYAKVDARYFDLSNKYLLASEILSSKTDAWIKAYEEYQEASAQAKRIYEQMKSIESFITKF